MKITRQDLKRLIAEELGVQSALLEGPMPSVSMSPPSGPPGRPEDGFESVDLTGQKLFHMAQQAQQLHDILKGHEGLIDDYRDKIGEISTLLNEIFESVTYDAQHPEGR